MGNEFLIECLLVFGCGQLPFAEKTQCSIRPAVLISLPSISIPSTGEIDSQNGQPAM